MKPIDDNEDISKDTSDDEKDSVDIEIKMRKTRRPRRRNSSAKEHASLISFVAWICFTIIWLFFFASEYSIFNNIAVVFIALLIIGALNAILWIPSAEGRRTKASAVSGIAWMAFLIIWIIFYALGFGFYENIGIALASLLIVGLVNMLLWVPKHGEEGGARVSGSGAIGWLIFIVLWLPFADNFSAMIYPITFYQSAAIVLASIVIMFTIVVAPWWGKMQISIDGVPSVGTRPKTTVGLFFLWVLALASWMWFFADVYTLNQNIAAVLFSFAIFCALIIGIWYSWTRNMDEGPESWFSIGLAFAWLLTLSLWFWFFAGYFELYQNIAVFLVTLLIIAAISGSTQWRKWREFEAMDWKD
jgi:MFS family permease